MRTYSLKRKKKECNEEGKVWLKKENRKEVEVKMDLMREMIEIQSFILVFCSKVMENQIELSEIELLFVDLFFLSLSVCVKGV